MRKLCDIFAGHNFLLDVFIYNKLLKTTKNTSK